MSTHFIRRTPRPLAVAAILLALGCLPVRGETKSPPVYPATSPAAATTKPAPAHPSTSAAAAKATADDIRDIRGPKHIPTPWFWPGWLAGAALLTALGVVAWRWSRSHGRVVKLPYEIALERLEKARALMQPEHAREFSIAVSEIVRGYVEERFQVWAAHRTTEEFLHDLLEPSDALLAGHRVLLADFLHHCDLAKFAKWILSVPEMESMYGSAHTFVLGTGKPPLAVAAAEQVSLATAK